MRSLVCRLGILAIVLSESLGVVSPYRGVKNAGKINLHSTKGSLPTCCAVGVAAVEHVSPAENKRRCARQASNERRAVFLASGKKSRKLGKRHRI